MNTDMTPVQDGTLVRYHGSMDYMHGDYVVHASHDAFKHVSAYVDGQAYVLRKADAPVKMDNLSGWLSNVRRTSFTVIEEPTDV